MSDFNAPWAWDDRVWEECDPMQRAPWLVDAAGNPVLKGEIRCISEEFAHLIEAAPDLFEALRLCYDHCRLFYPEVEHNNVGEAVRAAIAKATGGQP